MVARLAPFAFVLLYVPCCFAQDAGKPKFEVASVKISTSLTTASRFRPIGAVINGQNVVLKLLLSYAYGVDGFNITGGPAWIDSDRFDIEAKAAPNTSDLQMKQMMEALLAERFSLQTHRETRDSRVFVLTAAKGGLKVQPLQPGSCTPRDPTTPAGPPAAGQKPFCGVPSQSVNGSNIVMDVVGMDSANWVHTLSLMLGRTVINETGLTGPLDRLHFEYTRDDLAAAAAADSGGISISTALTRQLGLKLDTARRPVEVLVIDRVEKPSAN